MEILDLDKLRIVSIPQAVRAVATGSWLQHKATLQDRFNTASGTRCCNHP